MFPAMQSIFLILHEICLQATWSGSSQGSLFWISDVPKLPSLPRPGEDNEDEDDEEESKEDKPKKHRKISGPKTVNPYANDESSMLIPIAVAIAVFLPTLFCLCKL